MRLVRAVVVGPIARLELVPHTDSPAHTRVGDPPATVIEAHIPVQLFNEKAYADGETLVVTPRRARVFLDSAAGI